MTSEAFAKVAAMTIAEAQTMPLNSKHTEALIMRALEQTWKSAQKHLAQDIIGKLEKLADAENVCDSEQSYRIAAAVVADMVKP